MDEAGPLAPLQVHLARVFFGLKASAGYVVAGGAALVASGLITRPTQDLDLFASGAHASVDNAKSSLLRALERRGHSVVVIHDSATFVRLVVSDQSEEVLVDLAIDSPPSSPPTVTLLGPTLAPLELAGRKLLAMLGRAEARDFADVYVLAQRFGREALLSQATQMDAGFDRQLLAQMMGTIGRFDDDEIPLVRESVVRLREFFANWAEEITG